MTRISSFSALPGAIIKTLGFFRHNAGSAALAAILPGLAAIALTWQTGAVTNESVPPNWSLYLLAFLGWYGATALSQAAMFRIAVRGQPVGFLGYQLGADELRLAASWALIFFLIFVAAGIALVIYAALMGAVSIVSREAAGLTPEDPVATGNIPDLTAYYGPAEWGVAIGLGVIFAVLVGGFAGRLLIAPAASIARRKVQALSVMAITHKRGFAVVLGAILCFVPAGLLVHGLGVITEHAFDAPVHQPARLFSDGDFVPGWPVYVPLAFLHGWLAAFLTTPLFAGLTTALYRAWGGDD
ncbi:hypothetical protein [Hyphobacterium sp.]|uniref:hypothetical protein n=1 Tax=Hyphobacterium sp. TaxID=2004662 RepID=UPI003749E13D